MVFILFYSKDWKGHLYYWLGKWLKRIQCSVITTMDYEWSMPKKKRTSFIGAWLKVDEKNKQVEYQADPHWLKNANDDEQNSTLDKLARMADAYRRAGYRIIDFVKKRF